MIRKALLPFLLLAFPLLASACASAPPPASQQQLSDRVAAFVQPTQDGRLAVVKSQLEAAGLAYEVQEFDGKRPAPEKGYNVTARFGPAEGREILLTAHYDAVVLPGGKRADGVVDNAASVVAMIEAARLVKGRTKHPVRLLLTDQEELGLVGAQAFITKQGIANIAAVINADVNGYGETLMYGLNNGPQSAGMIEAVKAVCAERSMPCLDFPQYPPSDDRAFVAAGAPTISLGFQPAAQAQKLRAFMLNPPTSPPKPEDIPQVLTVIHTPGDTMIRVDAKTLATAASTFATLVMRLDATLP
jgi:Zn-dependent M28 family amino/carboxypeptidase